MHPLPCLLSLVLLALLAQTSEQCHYSCLSCWSEDYASCKSCSQNQPLGVQGMPQNVENVGVCGGMGSGEVNVLGILLLVVVVGACLLIGGQAVFYFLLMFQSLGLLFLIEVYWIEPLEYLLSAFSYFMIFSYLTGPLKADELSFKPQTGYRTAYYLKNPNLRVNLLLIGPTLAIVFLILITVTLQKVFRKPAASPTAPESKPHKLIIALSTIFFLTTQQTMLIILSSLTFSQQNTLLDYLLSAIYFLFLVLYLINQCSYPLPFFRNKSSQFLMFFSRILGPLFLVFPRNVHFIFFIYMAVIVLFQLAATKQNADKRGINRLVFYKIIFVGSFACLFTYTLVQMTLESEKTSKIMGVICLFSVAVFMASFILELLVVIKNTVNEDDGSKYVQNGHRQGIHETSENTFQTQHGGADDPSSLKAKIKNKLDFSNLSQEHCIKTLGVSNEEINMQLNQAVANKDRQLSYIQKVQIDADLPDMNHQNMQYRDSLTDEFEDISQIVAYPHNKSMEVLPELMAQLENKRDPKVNEE